MSVWGGVSIVTYYRARSLSESFGQDQQKWRNTWPRSDYKITHIIDSGKGGIHSLHKEQQVGVTRVIKATPLALILEREARFTREQHCFAIKVRLC